MPSTAPAHQASRLPTDRTLPLLRMVVCPVLLQSLPRPLPAEPAFLAGTSSDFLDCRRLPRILRERCINVLVGPAGAGKKSVARRIAGSGALRFDRRELEDAVIYRIGSGIWPSDLLFAPSLILEAPVWLHQRPGVVRQLCELLDRRRIRGAKTVVWQTDADGSVHSLLEELEAGVVVVLGLRFPSGPRGRLKFAQRVCDELGISRELAEGTELFGDWTYERVTRYLCEQLA